MLSNVYTTFPHLPNLDGSKYLAEAQQVEFHQPFNDKFPLSSRSSVEDSKFIADLADHFGHARAYYLKTPPNTCYDFHRDGRRNTTINFLLNDVKDSVTFFKDDTTNVYKQIIQVNYELYRPTVLKTSEKHGVFNYSNETRYILSVGFHLDVSYDRLCNFLNSYQTSSY